MKLTKLPIHFILLFALFSANAQDNQLHDYVNTSIAETRSFYFERNRLLNPSYKQPSVDNLKPIVSVNGKNVDMAFLKLIAIHDTIKIDNMAKKVSYVPSSPAQKIMIQGWVQVEIKKSVFKDLWKIQKSNYAGRKKKGNKL